jgi:hypothetical protein
VNSYLEKHSFCERLISEPASANTFLIVVIPCHDEPDLLSTFKSLANGYETSSTVEVITVINSGEHAGKNVLEQNAKTFSEAASWIKDNSTATRKFFLIDVKDLPQRHAGVGLARKIGMDEAVRRFDDIHNPNGVIVCLDADCEVDKNYLSEIENHFKANSEATGCSIYFEHPLEGSEFDESIYEGIIQYELFLRFYCRGLAYAGFPYPFQTIGSSMAVRSSVYQKQGGMNRRRAGEDFYFLHKIFPLSNFTNLTSTRVIPSPRPSHRVPFGTGSAMQKYISTDRKNYPAYHIQSFVDLEAFFKKVPSMYSNEISIASSPPPVQNFLSNQSFENKLKEIRQHCASEKMFVKRFFTWFDGFMTLKFMHYARDNFYSNMEVSEAARALMKLSNHPVKENITTRELLLYYRKWEREL